MPMLPKGRIRQMESQAINDQPPMKKLKQAENSPRLESLLGAAGVISMEQRQQKNDIRTKESKDTITLAKSSDESAADKMMRFFTGKPCKERSKKSKAIKFPLKLMYVLQCGDFSDIISWTDNGLAFKVESALKLEDTVLPAIFKDAKFSSFRRKLNRWSFKRNRTAAHFTVSHPLFRRGDFRLCQMMSCSKADDISLPGPPASSGLYPDIAPQLNSRFDGNLSEPQHGREDTQHAIPLALRRQQQLQQQRAEAALMAGSQNSRIGMGSRMVSPEDDLPYSFRNGGDGLDMANYSAHGDALGYPSSLELSRARANHLARDPMLMPNRSLRHAMARDLNSLSTEAAMMEAQMAERGANADYLHQLGGGGRLSSFSSPDAMMHRQQLLRGRAMMEEARGFRPSIEEVMLAQEDMRRAYTNPHFRSDQEFLAATQQHQQRGRVVPRNADRILNDAFDILRYAP